MKSTEQLVPVLRNKKNLQPSAASLRDVFPTETPLTLELFRRMVEQHGQPLYRYFAVHAGGDLVSAQEMTLETFSMISRKPAISAGQSFNSWLFGIAWDALNAHESRTGMGTGLASTQKNGRNHVQFARTLTVLRSLPFYPREALYLRIFAELKTRDIVILMEKSDTAVKALIYRGVLEFASRVDNLAYEAPSRKQMASLAQAYHRYLDDLFAEDASQPEIADHVLRATHQLKNVHERFTLKADVRSHLLSQTEQMYRFDNSNTTRL